jgi:hypothetical protein
MSFKRAQLHFEDKRARKTPSCALTAPSPWRPRPHREPARLEVALDTRQVPRKLVEKVRAEASSRDVPQS